jgi:hypothetical protein
LKEESESCGSNTSTVALRAVGGDEEGSLESDTIKYCNVDGQSGVFTVPCRAGPGCGVLVAAPRWLRLIRLGSVAMVTTQQS